MRSPAEYSVTSSTGPDAATPLECLLAGLRLGLGRGAGNPEADADALSRAADWKAVATLARRHGVEPLFFRGMRLRPGLLPASGLEPGLEAARERATQHALKQIGGLKRMTGSLAARDIPCLVLKGLPLSQRLHGHPAARGSLLDIDLLVSPHTFRAAEQALIEDGWRRIEPSFPETPVRNRWHARFRHDHKLVGPGGLLELHRRLSHNPFYFDAPFEDLYANSVPVKIGTVPLRVLEEDDEFIYLICHGARHYWKNLIWLCDVAALLSRMGPERFERVSMRCREAGLESILASALLLCREALHVRIPRGAAPLPAGGKRAAWIARLSQSVWDERDANGLNAAANWFRIRAIGLIAKPGLKALLHELAHAAVGPRDWARIDLPDRLFYLYFLLRPLLWLTRSRTAANVGPRRNGTRRGSPAR